MTSISELIKEIKEKTFWLTLFDLIFLIAPGVLLLFYFDRNLFLILDSIKVILLSISFIAPFIFIFVIMVPVMPVIKNKDNIFISFTIAIFLTNFNVCLMLFTSYLFKFSFIKSIFTLIIFQIISIICVGIFSEKSKR